VDETIAQEILHEFFSALEALETQSAALLQFVKDKGLATEQELAPYFEQAGNASNVRWRAARVRIDHLLASATKASDRDAQAKVSKPEEKEDSQKSAAGEHSEKNKEVSEKGSSQPQDSQRTDKDAARAKLEARDEAPAAENSDRHANEQRNTNDRKTGEKENQNNNQAGDNIKEQAA
jgi:hypothetical protein